MNVLTVILSIICAGTIATSIVLFILSRVKAEKLGVLRVKYPTRPAVFAVLLACAALECACFVCFKASYNKSTHYLYLLTTRGIPAIAEHERKSVDELFGSYVINDRELFEEIYLEREIAFVKKDIERKREQMRINGASAAVFLSVGFLGFGAYITKDGVMWFGALNPEKQTLVRAENGAYSFYVGKQHKYAFCLPLSEENERLFAGFIDKTTETENI